MADQLFQTKPTLSFMQQAILRLCPKPGIYPIASIQGLSLNHSQCSGSMHPHFFEPLLIMVVQGCKAIAVGLDTFKYGPGFCFLCGIDMPVSSCVMEASSKEPYLSLTLKLDLSLLAEFAPKTTPNPYTPTNYLTATNQKIDPPLLFAFARLLELVEDPRPLLDEILLREIHCRLLYSPFGGSLRSIVLQGTQGNKIRQAIAWLKENYAQPLSVEELSKKVNMAPSTFHKYFKEITSLSPLQYQKCLRLYKAQSILLTEDYDVTGAALAVGYESSTQFIREYKRLFGESPKRNVKNLKTSLDLVSN